MEIYIKNSAEPLVLFGASQLPSTWNNPFFNKQGSYSFDMTIPTAENAHHFGIPQEPGSMERRRLPSSLPARILLMSRNIQCQCRLTSANNNTISIQFFYNESPFYSKIKGKTLTDLPFENISIPVPDVATAQMVGSNVSFVTNEENDEERSYLFDRMQIFNPGKNHLDIMEWRGHDRLVYNITATNRSVYFLFDIDAVFSYTDDILRVALVMEEIDSQDNLLYKEVIQSWTIGPVNKLIIHRITNYTQSKKISFRICPISANPAFPIQYNSPTDEPYVVFINHAHITIFETVENLQIAPSFPVGQNEGIMDFFLSKYRFFDENFDKFNSPGSSVCNVFHRFTTDYFAFAGFTRENINPERDAYINNPIPSFYITYIVSKLEEYTGYKIVLPQYPGFDKVILMGFVSLLNFDYFKNPEGLLFYGNFNPAQVLPAKPIIELLEAIESATDTYMQVVEEEDKIVFKPKKNTLTQQEADDFSSDLVSLKYNAENRPGGYLIEYENHPDSLFTTYYGSLSELNFLGTYIDFPPGNFNVGDYLLIKDSLVVPFTRNNRYFFWNGSRWQFLSLYPAMEKFENVAADDIVHLKINMFPVLSLLNIIPYWDDVTAVIPETNLPVYSFHETRIKAELLEGIPLCFSVDRGIRKTRESNYDYLMASHDIYDSDRAIISSDAFNFQVNTDRGLYKRYMSEDIFFKLYKNDPFEANLLPSPDILFQEKKIQLNGNRFLIESKEFSVTAKKISEVKLQLRLVD